MQVHTSRPVCIQIQFCYCYLFSFGSVILTQSFVFNLSFSLYNTRIFFFSFSVYLFVSFGSGVVIHFACSLLSRILSVCVCARTIVKGITIQNTTDALWRHSFIDEMSHGCNRDGSMTWERDEWNVCCFQLMHYLQFTRNRTKSIRPRNEAEEKKTNFRKHYAYKNKFSSYNLFVSTLKIFSSSDIFAWSCQTFIINHSRNCL